MRTEDLSLFAVIESLTTGTVRKGTHSDPGHRKRKEPESPLIATLSYIRNESRCEQKALQSPSLA